MNQRVTYRKSLLSLCECEITQTKGLVLTTFDNVIYRILRENEGEVRKRCKSTCRKIMRVPPSFLLVTTCYSYIIKVGIFISDCSPAPTKWAPSALRGGTHNSHNENLKSFTLNIFKSSKVIA